MSEPELHPRKVVGAKSYNRLSHRGKVANLRLARRHRAVMFVMSYNFTGVAPQPKPEAGNE
jgi:hypothetical protein